MAKAHFTQNFPHFELEARGKKKQKTKTLNSPLSPKRLFPVQVETEHS